MAERPIEQLEAREIDALVAEKCMGWVRGKFRHPYGEIHDFVQFGPPEWFAQMKTRYACSEVPTGDESAAPHFSTDPAASKQLRDRMRADGWGFQMTYHEVCGWSTWAWFFRGFHEDGRKAAVGVVDKDELRAVALAALKAKGITHA